MLESTCTQQLFIPSLAQGTGRDELAPPIYQGDVMNDEMKQQLTLVADYLCVSQDQFDHTEDVEAFEYAMSVGTQQLCQLLYGGKFDSAKLQKGIEAYDEHERRRVEEGNGIVWKKVPMALRFRFVGEEGNPRC